jgi:Thioesterase-like superfamily
MADLPAALYEPTGGGAYAATALTRGPWDPRHQHAGPPSALLAHALEAAAGIEDGQVARIAVDILRPVPVEGELRPLARVVRGGRRVEQLEAVLEADGTAVMRARAWRMRTEPLELPAELAVPAPAPDGPDGLPDAERPPFWTDDVAYFDALDWRFVHGRFDRSGPAAAWTRLRVPLVAGEPATPLEHLLVMADAASGISSTLDWQRFSFANVDFSVALQRPPATTWLAMDAVTRLGDRGAGVCTGLLSDGRGRVGVSTQALFVAGR